MFKTLLRTLSALSITTISLTASMSFAEHPAHTLDLPCTDPANAHTEKCRAEDGIESVTTDVWKDSFESGSVPPPTDPNPASRRDQFILPEASVDHYELEERVNLKFDINNDGKNAIVGTSIFYIAKNGNERNFYAGIRIGADLGAPLVEAFPEAVWKTRFKAVGSYNLGVDFQVNEIFDLTVKFISNSADPEAMGELSGYIQHTGYYGFKIEAQFNNDGVITGTDGITYGRFQNAQAEPTNTVVGNLTGIIGERGALGAFHSNGNSNSIIRGFAGGFRANGYSEDELVTLRKCVLDPFHAQCSEDTFDDLKEARIELCIEGDNASDTNQIECHNAVVAEGCILNPFQATCTGEESDFNQYSEVARANRIAFCDNSVNAKDAFCKVGTIVADACADNPFHAICGSGYDGARNTLIATCHNGGACAAAVLELPNAATWANSFKTAGNPQGLGDAVADTTSSSSWMRVSWNGDPERHFLKNIKGVLPSEMVTAEYVPYIYTSSGRIYNYRSMNLKTAEFSIDGTATDLGGDVADGVATLFARNNYPYVGIFSTTDLGAPLTTPLAGEPKTASWVGSFQAGIVHDSGDLGYQWSLEDFVLEVNFDKQSIEAFVVIDESYSANLVKGKYDDSGVISGDVYRSRGYNTRERMLDRSLSGSSYSYSLTGLIGKEGAVGVFAGRLYGGKFVARPADLVELVVDENTKKTAETFLNETCRADPFHKFCYLSDQRKDRIDECITNDGVLDDVNCKKAREHHSCMLHPFDEKCRRTFPYHNDTMDKPYYEIARTNRSNFCGNPDSTGDNFDTLCKGAAHVALCFYDPFNRICLKQSDAFCANDPDHLYCGNAVYDNVRKVVCKAGSSHESCATKPYSPSSNVTAASWLYSFYEDNKDSREHGAFLKTKLGSYGLYSQFLQGTEDGLDNGDVEIRIGYYRSKPLYGLPLYGDLNLDTSTFDGLEFGRDKDKKGREDAADDGVAYFWGVSSGWYAGIFSGTDLGEPLMRPAKNTATWYGQFKIIHANEDVDKTDFTLEINFNGESTGTVEAFIHDDYEYYYLLQGDFDENGVISGTVDLGGFANHDRDDTIQSPVRATLTGLIGAEGAVGVFIGDYIQGGFVASSKSAADAFDPNVKASDWVRSFGNTPTLPDRIGYNYNEPRHQTRFVQGTETGLDIEYRSTVPISQTLTLADVRTDREAADGVAYVSGLYGRFAGILSGTNLGAALPTVPAGANGAITAIWYGKLGLIANAVEIPKRDIDLMVDFTNKRISHSSDVGGKHLVNFSATWNSGVGYDGMLDGVFTGDITYDATPTLHNGSYVANDNSKSDGTVTGLIGQDGAVGAFKSDEGSTTQYAGGFVATPGVDHLAWMNSFSNPSDVSVGVGNVPSQKQTQFVQGTGTSLNVGLLDNSVTRTLKLTDGDLGGDAADGAVYASGTWEVLNAARDGTNRTPRHYAGLLSGTNLGLPLPRVPASADGNPITAIWDGKLGLIANRVEIPKRDIDLAVDFTNNKISYSDAVNGAHFVNLNANWESGVVYNGVLKGTITYNPGAALDNLGPDSTKNSAGIVTGLIGQQGAVGAFRSNHVDNPTATHTSFAGGFVAVPVANYLIWKHSFGNPTSLPTRVPWYADGQPQTEFLQGMEAKLDPGFINTPVPRSLDFANSGLGGEATDGVAYLSGTWDVDSSDVPRHFAGILSGTNLGALLNAPVTATWNGKLGLIADGNGDIPKRDITLNIDFARKGIEIAYTRAPSRHFVAFNGLSFDKNGVITGAMTYNPGAALNDATNSAGKVTGLIGQQGAVGAFISNHDNPSSKAAYAGGFVAVPPSE